MTAQIKLDEIVKTPDIKGKFGRAWRADIAEAQRLANVRPEDDGSVVMWIVEAPWAHPIWHSYAVILVHLRPLPDGRPTKFYLAAATHEIWLDALDPDQPRQPMIEFGQLKRLTPKNFAAQFIAASDEAAKLKVEEAVRDIVAGKLSPDTDFIRHWAYRFGDNMLKEGAGETRIVTDPGEPEAREIVIPPHPGPQDRH